MHVLAAASILIGAGCTVIPQPLKTYDGPELPTQAVALIAGEVPQPSESSQRFDTGGVYIPCMDGVSLERNFGGYDDNARWPNKLTVTPGRHYLAVVYSFPRVRKALWATIAMDVEAGRKYVVRKEVTGKDIASASVRMWVEDATNGVVVASAAPDSRHAVMPCQ